MRTVLGACHHDCPDSCGWVVTVDDEGRATKLRGNPDHPFSVGELCPKVNRFLERVYSPDRILTPLRRSGPKGSGQFEPVSWDEALGEIGARWSALAGEFGGETLMPMWDAGNQSHLAMHGGQRFLQRFGASQMTGNVCGQVAGEGLAVTYGSALGAMPSELEYAKCVVLWGTNTRLTNRHLWPFVEKARANGAVVVCVDPMRTITADSSDVFVQPLPGTDVALLYGLLHIIIRDGFVDHDYVQQHSSGFEDLAAESMQWPPSRVADVCGLTVVEIENFAALISKGSPTHFRTLIGAEHREHGGQFFRLLACLPVVLGSWRHRGGGVSRSVGTYVGSIFNSLRTESLSGGRVTRALSMHQIASWLPDVSMDNPVRALLVWNFNPLVSLPNSEGIRRGLLREDLFTVVHEQFLTDTARYADIVLPATTQIESVDIVPSWGSPHVNWNGAAIAPLGESVSNTELFRRLSKAMGYTEPELFASDEELLDIAINEEHRFAQGISVAQLRDQGTIRLSIDEDFRPYAYGGFGTPDGKAHLSSAKMSDDGLGLVALYVPSHEGPQGPMARRYPLSLMTPKVHPRFLNAGYSHLPNHGGREGGPYVELSANDAAARAISDGDLVEVANDRARLTLRARIGTTVRDGVVSVPFGWHAQAHGDGHTANSLTNDAPTSFGGGVAYLDTQVEVRRL